MFKQNYSILPYFLYILSTHSSFYRLNHRANTLDFLSLHESEHMSHFSTTDGHISVTVVDIDTANISTPDFRLFTKESHNIALGDFVLFSLTNIERRHS